MKKIHLRTHVPSLPFILFLPKLYSVDFNKNRSKVKIIYFTLLKLLTKKANNSLSNSDRKT